MLTILPILVVAGAAVMSVIRSVTTRYSSILRHGCLLKVSAYIGYPAFQILFFDRFIACFKVTAPLTGLSTRSFGPVGQRGTHPSNCGLRHAFGKRKAVIFWKNDSLCLRARPVGAAVRSYVFIRK